MPVSVPLLSICRYIIQAAIILIWQMPGVKRSESVWFDLSIATQVEIRIENTGINLSRAEG